MTQQQTLRAPIHVKICGLTQPEDIITAVNAGAQALGFVFFAQSPRAVTAEQAQVLLNHVPPFVQTVGLFVNAGLERIEMVLQYAPVDILQFHGHETSEQCAFIARMTHKRWIKALQVQPEVDIVPVIHDFMKAGASGIVLDAWHPDLMGGTGQTFNWQQWPDLPDIPLILAGGLTPQNVREAIAATQPYAVDVSGGVELWDTAAQALKKGYKDAARIKDFIQAVHQSGSLLND